MWGQGSYEIWGQVKKAKQAWDNGGRALCHLVLKNSAYFKALVAQNRYLKRDSLKNAKYTLHNFSKAGSLHRYKKHLLCLKFINSFNLMIQWADITMYLSLECLHFRERMSYWAAQIRTTPGYGPIGKCVKGRSLRFTIISKQSTKCSVVSQNGS